MRNATAPKEETGEVAALNHDGQGVIRAGKTAFVAGALPGETVRFQRVRRHRQYDEARLLEVITPVAERVDPRCAHFGVCGGCALQHIAPEAQLQSKRRELEDNFERIGRVKPDEWLSPLEGPVWNYRRRARLGAKYVAKKGRVVVGFRERLAPYVAALDRCDILAPPMHELIAPLGVMLSTLSIRERLPQVEVAVGDASVALVLRVLSPPTEEDLDRLRAFATEHGVTFYLQSGGIDTVTPLDGKPAALSFALPDFGIDLAFEPTDFIQVNGAINRALVTRAVDLLAPTRDDRVLDLYCGLGNFTLALAKRAGSVIGVEGDAGLVARARANAQRNGLDNVEFHAADLSKLEEASRLWAGKPITQVLIDPPRVGAKEILPAVAKLAPRRIVYIACHPGSLARDVGTLVHEHGFRLRSAGVLDMFPHTTHVESIAVLEPG